MTGRPVKALFFADGGPGAGLGHLRRCGALADAFAAKGWECRFVAPNPEAASWLNSRGRTLAPSKPASSGRLPEADYRCDVFVADAYPVTNEELAATVRPKARLILAFDDHMNRHEAADVILSTGALAPTLDWPGRVERLLGPQYHPLSAEFLPLSERRLNPELRRVLVTLGGSGDPAVLAAALRAIEAELPGVVADAIVGPFAGRPPEGARANWIADPRSLKELFLGCDLAVSASGQTLFELAATGTPAIAVGLAENQKDNLAGMEASGAALSAGWAGEPGFEERLRGCLRRAKSADLRRRLSESGRRLIDGRGGERVADALARLLASRRAAA